MNMGFDDINIFIENDEKQKSQSVSIEMKIPLRLSSDGYQEGFTIGAYGYDIQDAIKELKSFFMIFKESLGSIDIDKEIEKYKENK